MSSPVARTSGALTLPFVRLHELHSRATGECWQIAVSQAGPPGAAEERRLLVLLDGGASTAPAALMQHARMARGVGAPAPCTVVGVGYPGAPLYDRERRAHDYLPPLPAGLDPAAWPSGRADAFAAFLDEQLLPWMQAQQGGAPFSEVGLFGHSFGGLFVLYKLLQRPGRFDAFFSISPSLWWADGWLLTQLAGAADRCAGRALFLGIGADERAMPGDDEARVALHRERDLQGRYARLVGALKDQHIGFTTETFAGEDHGSVLYPALTRAVRWLTRPAARATPHFTQSRQT